MQEGYADYEYRPAKRRHRRRRSHFGRLLLLLLLIAAVLTVWRSTDGFSKVHLPAEAPKSNIETDFKVDLDALSKKYTADMSGFSPSGDDLAALRETAEKNKQYKDKIEFFIDHVGAYDQTAVNTVLLAPEKIDFVLLCPFEKYTPVGNWSVDVKKGTVPYFIQYDSRWAFHQYGSSFMGNTACGPTCLAMAAAGLTGNGSYTPDYVADYAEQNGYYVPGSGTSWNLFTSGAAGLSLTGEEVSTDKSAMESSLQSGGVLVASMMPGDFTKAGHFIVIYKYGLGGFQVYDPSCIARSGRTWSYDRLQPQIAQLWCLTAK